MTGTAAIASAATTVHANAHSHQLHKHSAHTNGDSHSHARRYRHSDAQTQAQKCAQPNGHAHHSHSTLSDDDDDDDEIDHSGIAPMTSDEPISPEPRKPQGDLDSSPSPSSAQSRSSNHNNPAQQHDAIIDAVADIEADADADIDIDPDSADQVHQRRVKVYSLNDLGHWEDRGTGQISVVNPSDLSMIFIVRAETGASTSTNTDSITPHIQPDVLLHHRVVDGLDYQRQGETIVTWCDQGTANDVALSFENEPGCSFIWALIMNLQQTYSENELVVHDRHALEPEEEAMLVLPIPSKDTLTDISNKLSSQSLSPPQKDYLAQSLLMEQQQYLPQLWALHTQFESVYEDNQQSLQSRLSALQSLECLFGIFKNLILLNESNFIEYLISEQHLVATIAALEYDSAYSQSHSQSLPEHDYHAHRHCLSSAQFLTFDALSQCDASLCDKIRQSYHLTYIKDVLLLRHLDDSVMATMSSMLFLNAVHVIQKLNENRSWMKTFFDSVTVTSADTATATESASVRHSFSILQELLSLAKGVQVPLRDSFYRALIDNGLITIIERTMQSLTRTRTDAHTGNSYRALEADKECEKENRDSMWLWIACTDMLTSLLMHDASHVRLHLLTQRGTASESQGLFALLTNTLCRSRLYLGMGHTISCVLRLTLDPEMAVTSSTASTPTHSANSLTHAGASTNTLTVADPDSVQTAFLDYVYDSYLPQLVNCLPLLPKSHSLRNIPFYLQRQFHIIELLAFCVLQHPAQFPLLVKKTRLFQRIKQLWQGLASTNRNDLRCSIVRLLRTCLATKESDYCRSIIDTGLLRLLMECFLSSTRYNILNSSLMDLWLLMKNEHVAVCMDWLCQHYGAQLESLTYVIFFQTWRKDWDTLKNRQSQSSQSLHGNGGGVHDGHNHGHGHNHHHHHNHSHSHSCDSALDDDDVRMESLDDFDADAATDHCDHGSGSDSGGSDTDNDKTEPLTALNEDTRTLSFTSNTDEDNEGGDDSGNDSEPLPTIPPPSQSSPSLVNARVVERIPDDCSSTVDADTNTVANAPNHRRITLAHSHSHHNHNHSHNVSKKRRSIEMDDGSSSPLSIIITKSPTIHAASTGSPHSPPSTSLTFSLSRVPHHAPSSSPGSPPLPAQPTSPRSPTQHILRSRSPPPPTLGASPSKARQWGAPGSPEVKARTLSADSPLSHHPVSLHSAPQRHSMPAHVAAEMSSSRERDAEDADRKRRKTMSV